MFSIIKQSIWLLLAQISSRAIGFFYNIFLAKSLQVENFGLYVAALSYFSILSAISEFGINQYLIREVAIDKNRLSHLLASSIILRLTITSVLFALLALFMFAIDPNKLRVAVILIAVLAVIPQSATITFDSIFVALRKLRISAVGLLVLNLSTSLLGFLLVKSGFGILGALWALFIGQIIYVVVLGLIALSYKLRVSFNVSSKALKEIIRGALPYGILGILGILYFKIDSPLLLYLRGAYDAGIYGVAYKFLEAVIFIPSALSAALFPVLAKLAATEPNKVYSTYLKTTKLFLAASLIVVLIYLTILPTVITRFLPQYLPAIGVIQVLTLAVPFFFMITPQAAILLSHKTHLKKMILLSIFNLALNISLNLMLIPKYGYFGAAWVTVISDVIGFVIFFIFIKRYYGSIR